MDETLKEVLHVFIEELREHTSAISAALMAMEADAGAVSGEIERLYREAPMLLIGEGTSDIQKMIIGRRLLEEYKLRG